MSNNEKLVFIQRYYKQISKEYSKYIDVVEVHIKDYEENLEKLGLTEKIVAENGFKLGAERYEKLQNKYSKSKIMQDVNLAHTLNQEATKITKEFLVKYYEFKEEVQDFLKRIGDMNTFETYEEYSKYLENKFILVERLKDEMIKFMSKDIKEHTGQFDSLKKYKSTYSDIVTEYDLTSMKSNNVFTELHTVFKKSYITQ
ncbi:MAG: hypothetical protein QM490_01920 [Candidatus Gracilibacteria bacterium]